MASTNKTPNLGLSQWEQSDAFERKDLNADFLKIDRAYEACGKETLIDVTVSETVNALDLDISSFDMNNYTELEIYMDLVNPGMREMTIDNITDYTRIEDNSTGVSKIELYGNMFRIALSRKISYLSQNYIRMEFRIKDSNLPNIRILHLKASNASLRFDQGDRIIVKGVKK